MENKWQRFKTTRLYVHPPKAERLFTLWRDGKIMLGEIETPINQPYKNVGASGIYFIGADGCVADFTKAEYKIREDGIPVHILDFSLGSLSLELELASPFERRPSLYGKLTVSGNKAGGVCEKFGFVLRTAKEEKLVFCAPDVYGIYKSNLENWLNEASSWRYDGHFTDGDVFLDFPSDHKVEFDAERGISEIPVCLSEGETAEYYFVFGKGDGAHPKTRDEARALFESAKSSTISSWKAELSKVTKLPASIKENAEHTKMINNLTCQLLQCFCYGKDTEKLYSRQGGLQRRVWTYEAMPVLECLMRIGDFEDYVEPVIDVYFTEFFKSDGEIVPLGIHWAMATGTVLSSFGTHSKIKGEQFFKKYRDKAMKSFDWMYMLRRRKTYDGAITPQSTNRIGGTYLCVDGLFPPMSACDDPLVFQAWLSTDGNNILGLKEFAEACEMFGDERAEEVRREYEEYKAVLAAAFQKFVDEAKDSDELKIPYTPAGDNAEVTERYHFSPSMGFLMNALRPSPEIYNKIINYYARRGLMIGGLYNKMPDKDPNIPGNLLAVVDDEGHSVIWYVCAQEYGWFKCMMDYGESERCEEIIKDSVKFAMSDEYYMIERYHESNPWYGPWSPNASCNGRMINMLLDFYGK